MNKIKMIDLLNKKANGEELPKKIKFKDVEYILKGNEYYHDIWKLAGKVNICNFLNVEAEIIEGEINMDKQNLVDTFNKAKEQKKDIAIWVTVPTRNKPEIIIVDRHNLQYKLDYYLNAYDEQLKLKTFSEIRILDVKIFDLGKIEEVLSGKN